MKKLSKLKRALTAVILTEFVIKDRICKTTLH